MEKFARIQSPSSINTYKQCPRKYFYQYIQELKTKPSIHLIRGKIVHSVLEDFFLVKIENISKSNYDFELKVILYELLNKHWQKASDSLNGLGLDNNDVVFYLEETKQMIQFWLLDFLKKLKKEMKTKSLEEAYAYLKPQTEVYFKSEEHGVQGYMDAIIDNTDGIQIVDYKTSKRDHISNEYRLQLAIYAMLYKEKFGELPGKVGIHFLRTVEKFLDVDKDLVYHAEEECKKIHQNTKSKDIKDYPRFTSPLCKWRTGECDFYESCKKKP